MTKLAGNLWQASRTVSTSGTILPPISERLLAFSKAQLWPEVTEGPKVFPKLDARSGHDSWSVAR